jgi:HAD superfamily hydrolase (TIGR01549 family)
MTTASATAFRERAPGPDIPGPGLVNPLDPARRIRAVLFDLDGTLYRQRPVRMLMAMELLTLPLQGPFTAPRRWRALRAYRVTHEDLRARSGGRQIAAAQTAVAAARAGLSRETLDLLVREWMQERPLKYLRRYRAAGLDALLALLEAHQVQAGVLSDYPPELKLRALGLENRFAPVLCSTDPNIDALKPHPRGFLRACASWHLSPGEVLMVGDRPDVDAAGADAAGMPCVIIGAGVRKSSKYLALPSLERLHRVLLPR